MDLIIRSINDSPLIPSPQHNTTQHTLVTTVACKRTAPPRLFLATPPTYLPPSLANQITP